MAARRFRARPLRHTVSVARGGAFGAGRPSHPRTAESAPAKAVPAPRLRVLRVPGFVLGALNPRSDARLRAAPFGRRQSSGSRKQQGPKLPRSASENP